MPSGLNLGLEFTPRESVHGLNIQHIQRHTHEIQVTRCRIQTETVRTRRINILAQTYTNTHTQK